MVEHPSDAILLERFVSRREEAAFAALVRRHGPAVRAACLRILPSEHDAEDVVQSTFLVLARRAGEVAWNDSVRGWLCGVARRLSMRVRAGSARRGRFEASLADPDTMGGPTAPAGPFTEVARRELCRVVDQELTRLPDKYRDPVLLCDLEGLTHQEAARRLGLPAGSMSRRLDRARALLRRRLVGRGMAAALTVLALVGAWVLVARQEAARTSAVRAAMSPFASASAAPGPHGLEQLVGRIETATSAEAVAGEALDTARDARRLAARLQTLAPVTGRNGWREYLASLDGAAVELGSISRGGDLGGMLTAARKLDGACVRCHLTLRQ